MTMKVKQKEPRQSNETKPERRVKAAHLKFDEEGRELMDPTPIAPPIGYKKSPSIADQIREMVRSERLRQETEAAGYESFEEADDFDVGDDFDPKSPYEEVFEPLPERDDQERLKTLGDHIGNAIVSRLGGDQQPEMPPETSGGKASPKPSGSGAPGDDFDSPPPPTPKDAGETKGRGFLKPRQT